MHLALQLLEAGRCPRDEVSWRLGPGAPHLHPPPWVLTVQYTLYTLYCTVQRQAVLCIMGHAAWYLPCRFQRYFMGPGFLAAIHAWTYTSLEICKYNHKKTAIVSTEFI